MIELRILGTQFGDPISYMMWIKQSFGVSMTTIGMENGDRIIEARMDSPIAMHVMSSCPCYWDINNVFQKLLAHVDKAILVLTRIHGLMHLNQPVIEAAKFHLAKKGIVPLVLANNVHGDDPKSFAVPACELRSAVPMNWPIVETTIGRFNAPLFWTFGAQEAWDRIIQETKESQFRQS